ncbi:hypothetical protein [Streptomyces sp. YIM 98790]|uniref:hypothetical protein n=1 Tax=Streptomyces sp. YIM 98790 TaxID=2689077 RepID=UPI00140CC463|nr:hypothetical protein [Streptomyces sp. YIM 98790]
MTDGRQWEDEELQVFARPSESGCLSRDTYPYGEGFELPLPSGPVRIAGGSLPVAPPHAQRDAWPSHRLH